MCALELRSAHLYWHVSDGRPVDWFLTFSQDGTGVQELFDEAGFVAGKQDQLVAEISCSLAELLDRSFSEEAKR